MEDGDGSVGLNLDLLAVGGLNAADDVIFNDDTRSLGVVDGDGINLALDGDDARIKLGDEHSFLGVANGDYDVLLVGVSLDEPVVSLLFGHVVFVFRNTFRK